MGTGIKCSKSLDAVDKKMAQAAGCSFLRLNGCPECRHHVYGQGDERTHCPHVNEKHEVCGKPRHGERGVPFEEVFYFPLIPRLRALLRTKQFRKLIQHEIERPCNPSILSDIYDSPAWEKFAGQAGSERIDRILLQFCIDGIPAFAAGTLSLKPAEFINLNLPPALRCKSENIMLFMLIPATLKHCKKYYDFAATYELNELYEQGFCLCVVASRSSHQCNNQHRCRGSQSPSFRDHHGHQGTRRASRYAGDPVIPKLSCVYWRVESRLLGGS